MDTPEVLAATQAYYRTRVFKSWVFQHLYDRHLGDIVKPAQIGYAPAGWDSTIRHLKSLGATDDQLIEAGVATHSRDGRLLDVLRDRMVFPITDNSGQLAGFLGRCQPGSDEPKYINTPTTQHFNKGHLFYGLGDQLPELLAGAQPIIVEGPLDRWGVHRAQQHLPDMSVAGLAPCGTAFTEHQLAALQAASSRAPMFAFDNDQAGRKATLRAWETINSLGNADVKAIQLPAGQDPADLHPKQLAHLIKHAEPMAVTVARLSIEGWGRTSEPNTARTTQMIQTLTRRDLLRVPPEHITSWIRTIGRELRVDAQAVNSIVFGTDPSPPPRPPQIGVAWTPSQTPQAKSRAHTR